MWLVWRSRGPELSVLLQLALTTYLLSSLLFHSGDCCLKAAKAIFKGRKRMDPNTKQALLATQNIKGGSVEKKLVTGGIPLDTINPKALRDEISYLKHMRKSIKSQQKNDLRKIKYKQLAEKKAFEKQFVAKGVS